MTIAKRPSSRPRDARKSARDLPDGTSALACDMLARRAICAWQVCWPRRLHNLGQLRRSPGDPSTPQPLRDGICSASRARSCGEGTVSEFVNARSASDEAIHCLFARRHGLLRCARNDAERVCANLRQTTREEPSVIATFRRHCEERSDEAIHLSLPRPCIASPNLSSGALLHAPVALTITERAIEDAAATLLGASSTPILDRGAAALQPLLE